MSVVAKPKTEAPDWWLLVAVVMMLGIGLVMVYSASAVMAAKVMGDKYHFIMRQSVFAVAGLAIMWITSRLSRNFWLNPVYLWLALAIVCLGLTLGGPLATKVNGASRWLRLGPVAAQPLELAKVALVLYLSYFFGRKQEIVKRFAIGFVPPFAITGLLCVLLLKQPDFGGAAFLVMLLLFMSLVGGTRVVYLLASVMLAAFGAWTLIMHSPYRFKRFAAFLDPFADPLGSGYQLVQSLYAFGSGNLFGAGLGAGRQKLLFLPEAHNDFIMAVLGEELGFLGVSIVLALIGVILWRAFVITLDQDSLRDRLAGLGMTLILGLGFLLNLAVVLGTVPPKGVPMPFMSYGGSHLLTACFAAGFLLNLSRGRVKA